MEARFSVPDQTGPGAHPASCTIGTGSFPGVKSGRGVTLTTHPLLVPWPRKIKAITLLPLWAVRPVQSLNTCTRAHFTFLPLCCFSYTCNKYHPLQEPYPSTTCTSTKVFCFCKPNLDLAGKTFTYSFNVKPMCSLFY